MKVLIIKQGALGDVIFATPILRQIQEHHSKDELWLLTTPAYESLFDNWDNLSVKAFPRKGLINTWRTIIWLRRQKFDCLYDLQSNDRSRVLTLFSGAPKRVGNHPNFPYTFHPPAPYTGQCHAFDRLNQILASAHIPPAPPRPALPIAKATKDLIDTWLEDQGLMNKKLVILHAGASVKHPAKRWPYYGELAQALAAESFCVIWIGARDDMELNRELSKKTGVNTTGEFNVQGLIELGRHVRFAVANDSAPMHILSCSGIPVFGIFGPTDWRRNYALGQKDRVITLDHAAERKQCDPESMKLEHISPAMVLDRIKSEGLA